MYYNLYYMMNDFEAFYICSRNQNETGCGSFLCAHRLYKVLTIQTKIDMEVRIQISDAVYASLLGGTKRVQGTIGLVSPTEGNFNAHVKKNASGQRTYLKLPHGKVSMNENDIRMYLKIAYAEPVIPTCTIEAESALACSFINMMEEVQ